MSPGGQLPYLVVGNPENRRVGLFQEALAVSGRPPADVVAWRDVLRNPAVLAAHADTPRLVRIDATGENDEVERLLLARGYAAARAAGVATIAPDVLATLAPDRGRILCPRQHHLGFEDALAELDRVFAARPSWRVLAPPAAIAELFDKRRTSRRYAALGIPVPRALPDAATPEALRAAMHAAGEASVYVKLSCGSSASCLAVFERNAAGRERLTTTIEMTPAAWYNSLRVRRYHERAAVDAILAFLLREGAQIEAAVPKARQDGQPFDCRVLVIAGEPAFVVVRVATGAHPITNLHLGGRRGDVDALRASMPPAAWDAAMDSCRRVHAAHGCLHVGVDLLFEPDHGHRVLEANAFGDLLPNLRRDGLSVHEWEIRAADGVVPVNSR